MDPMTVCKPGDVIGGGKRYAKNVLLIYGGMVGRPAGGPPQAVVVLVRKLGNTDGNAPVMPMFLPIDLVCDKVGDRLVWEFEALGQKFRVDKFENNGNLVLMPEGKGVPGGA